MTAEPTAPGGYNERHEYADENGEEPVQQFAVVVRPDPEDEGFVATVPGLPGVVGRGQTEEEALEHARAALESSDAGDSMTVQDGEGGTRVAPRPFDTDENLDALAADQGVKAANDFDALLGDFWPEDESADEFVAALSGWRREPKVLPNPDA